MSKNQNPYETPVNGDSHFDPNANFDRMGMLSLIAGTAILGGLDYAFLGLGVFAGLGPIILFALLTIWSVFAGTRGGKFSTGTRIALGVVLSLVSVPVSFALLLFTCMPATSAAGGYWDIHSGKPAGNTLLFGLITAALIALVGLILFSVAYLLPRAIGKSKPELQGSKDSQQGK